MGKMNNKTHHVIRNPDGGWVVRKGGAARVSGKFETQQEAVIAANQIVKNQGTRLVVHQADGRIIKVK